MNVDPCTLAGDPVSIHYVTRREDLTDFENWFGFSRQPLGFDTESSGLDIFSQDHKLRLVQFGDQYTAYVIPVDGNEDVITKALQTPRWLVAHNASFDALTVARHLGVDLRSRMQWLADTRIYAHLLDPRGPHEGGIGLGLKPLSARWVDPEAPDTQDGLTAVFRSLKLTKATGFARIPIDHPTYVRYAGLDALLAWRLYHVLKPKVAARGLTELARREHTIQALLARLELRGIRLDVPYVQALKAELAAEADAYKSIARDLGVTNVSSTTQVAQALLAGGEALCETTRTGRPKVDRVVLGELADINSSWDRVNRREPNPLATAVLHAKRAGKWHTAYASAFLKLRDGADRLHPSIGGLAARTGRMSVSRPPLQQLPTGDWRIRRCFIPDEGNVLISVDYKAVEMRVLAALSGDMVMKEAIAAGVDLHDFTAEKVFGAEFSHYQRKLAKAVGFGKVYGGGARTLARQTGADIDAIEHTIDVYDRTFPMIKRFSRSLADEARQCGYVTTPIGRQLPVDQTRFYSATNYVIQSASRDLLAQSIVDLFAAGMGQYLLLPIHDELLAQAPAEDAADIANHIAKLMEHDDFYGVQIAAEPTVVGPSWGHAYGAPTKEDN